MMKTIIHTALLFTALMVSSAYSLEQAQAHKTIQDSGVCVNNDYALCSHASCGCVDESGNDIACDDDKASGWAQCECPIVRRAELAENSPYRANFASPDLSCAEREKPEGNTQYTLPGFVTDKTIQLYSTYSYGDSVKGDKFNTLDSAKAMLCDQPDKFADCLNMACYESGDGTAICYCKTAAVASCKSGLTNTFGGDCDTGNCDLGKDKVWSGACITDTLAAMSEIFVVQNAQAPSTSNSVPAYCVSN